MGFLRRQGGIEVKMMRSEGTKGREQNLGGVFTNLQPRLSFLLDDYFHGWPMCFGYHSKS